MRIYRGKIGIITNEIVSTLVKDGDIEVLPEKIPEVELDIGAIMEQYIKTDEEIKNKAKDIMESRGLPYSELHKVKKMVAEEKGHKTGEEGIDWVIDQVLEGFMLSPNVEEVFAEDHTMRRKIFDSFKKHLLEDEEIDKEARLRLKNIPEGTPAWDLEYSKIVKEIRQKKGLY